MITQGIVSFVFDDFHASAADACRTIFAPIHHATFYTSGHFCGRPGMFTATHLRDLVAAGHELACHTYTHQRSSLITSEALASDVYRNARFIHETVPGYEFANFAYPFGDIPDFYDRGGLRHFTSRRSTRPGHQPLGTSDPGATKLYTARQTLSDIVDLIKDTSELNQWLILYTHDVTFTPSPFGCTPACLTTAYTAALSSGCAILSVKESLAAASKKD